MLNELMVAVGVKELEDSAELHEKECKIKVGIQEAQNGYDAKNNIKAYLKLGSQPTATNSAPIVLDDTQRVNQDDIPF